MKNHFIKNKIYTKYLMLPFFFIILFCFSINFSLAAGSYNFTEESGLSLTGKEAGYSPESKTTPEAMIGTTIRTILSFVGVIFLAFMIYGGITWLTAQGDNQKVTKAKAIIEESIVGIIIVIIAYSVSNFLVEYFTPIIGG